MIIGLGADTFGVELKENVKEHLATEFKSGWDDQNQVFLDQSMIDIQRIESGEFKRRRRIV